MQLQAWIWNLLQGLSDLCDIAASSPSHRGEAVSLKLWRWPGCHHSADAPQLNRVRTVRPNKTTTHQCELMATIGSWSVIVTMGQGAQPGDGVYCPSLVLQCMLVPL
jgi:hypothetical protein